MVQRTRIGLIFSYNENWIAGAYYILNIINALNVLKDELRPQIVIISETYNNFLIAKKETNYPYLSFHKTPPKAKYNLAEKSINKIYYLFFKKYLVKKQPRLPHIQFLYPNQLDPYSKSLKKVNWIPDFQEEFLPQYFSQEEINKRKRHQLEVICKGDYAVFSSKTAKNHFKHLYPNAKTKTFVLPFAVTHPNFMEIEIGSVLKKFDLPPKYFFAPNQFWAHKNHQIILDAVNILKLKKENIVVCFSGKENDYRNENYVNELKAFVRKNNLYDHIKFLGFIDRKEQLCLLEHAIAIIQPSLFEGWSTVVEDAKALNKHIVLSSLPVHFEQISKNVSFFDPNDPNELSEILKTLILNPPIPDRYDYKNEVVKFGQNFINLIEKAKV